MQASKAFFVAHGEEMASSMDAAADASSKDTDLSGEEAIIQNNEEIINNCTTR
jgi:hypothetical protein